MSVTPYHLLNYAAMVAPVQSWNSPCVGLRQVTEDEPEIMKAAFAHWDNRIAPVFDVARQLHIVEAEADRIIAEAEESLAGNLPVHRVLRLVELNVDTLVCGAISRPLHEMIEVHGIRVVPFVAGELGEIIQAWLGGSLSVDAYAMPGCFERGRRRRRGRAGADPEEGAPRPGQGRGRGAGGGTCICPQCGQRSPHERGVPCNEQRCSNCGAAMHRE